MEIPTTYATYPEIVAANQLFIVQLPRATGMAVQPYPLPPSTNTCDVQVNNEHFIPLTVYTASS